MFLGRSGGVIGGASVRVLDIEWTPEGNPIIPLEYRFPFGMGVSISQSSALVKPFRKLLDNGKPIGKVTFVFFRENGTDFVLGSFAFTDRIIFFPEQIFQRYL